MKRKFELIKEYPGSQKLGSIIEFKNGNHFHVYVGQDIDECGIKFNKEYHTQLKDCVEKTEFFKEIIQPTYQILEYFTEYQFDLGNFCSGPKRIESNRIKSVIRLSDGEIFSVGGVVEFYHNSIKCIRNIVGIRKVTDDILLNIEINFGIVRTSEFYLKDVTKSFKQPLFETEDGVKIFEGDDWWCAYDETYFEEKWRWKVVKWSKHNALAHLKLEDKSVHRFSTEELAKDYIKLYEPKYSIHDLRMASTSYGFGANGNFADVNIDLLITNKNK
jgi:hypothetical protein